MRSGKQGHSLLARPLGKPLRRKRARVYSSPTSRPQWADILGASLLTPMNIKEIAERQSAGAIEGAGGGALELRPCRVQGRGLQAITLSAWVPEIHPL